MKYFVAIFVTAILVFLGATVYYKGLPTFPSYNRNTISTQSGVPVTATEVAATPEATPVSGTTLTAGGILVFSKYSLNFPTGWIPSTDGSSPGQIDKLTLTKGAYKVVITQAAFGGGGCVYPGDPAQPMSISFNAFAEVTTVSGQKLRVGVLPSGNRAICEFQSGAWGDITEFGHIDITNPGTPTQLMLDEINAILASLKKI